MVAPHRSRPHDLAKAPAFAARSPRSRGGIEGGLTCLLTTLHPERALSLALVQHLAEEMPGIAFTLEDGPSIDVVWVCGYERGNPALIRRLRASHPLAVVVATAKEPEELWSGEVLAAGADSALTWPVDYAHLGRILRRRALQRRA
jgi:1,6-anhydro-N-acetylmuramate kinase